MERPPATPAGSLRPSDVFATWWPLAASWLLMGLELPAVSAAMARMTHPTESLAAYGGVVFPLALIVESPIIMFLSASTALCRDADSYRLVRRFMLWMAAVLTGVHALLAFTPLYDLVVGRWIAPPHEILEPAKRGLQILLPWTASIAYRRFTQGVLIRFGRPRAVSLGTLVRLAANLVVLIAGWSLREVPGIVVGSLAVVAGVVSEAAFAARMARPVLRGALRAAPRVEPPLTPRGFVRFYTPLALMPGIGLLAMPLASAAMSRMPLAIESLAAWPVVGGLVFTLRSVGFAMSEVTVSLLDRREPLPALRRFTILLSGTVTAVLLVVAATPLAGLWLAHLSALPPRLADLGRGALWIAFPLPALSALQSYLQGIIVHGRRTRAVTESVVLLLAAMASVLVLGTAHGRTPGLHVAMLAMVVGNAVQVAWLWWRARREVRALRARDAARDPGAPLEVAPPEPSGVSV
jgi:Na+-driven multidrug efflux pump